MAGGEMSHDRRDAAFLSGYNNTFGPRVNEPAGPTVITRIDQGTITVSTEPKLKRTQDQRKSRKIPAGMPFRLDPAIQAAIEKMAADLSLQVPVSDLVFMANYPGGWDPEPIAPKQGTGTRIHLKPAPAPEPPKSVVPNLAQMYLNRIHS